MGFPPPEDFPTPAQQDIVSADASFAPGPSASSICGFKFPPTFNFSFGFNLPPLPIPFKLPSFNISIMINCDLNNPFSLSGGVEYGGGRKATFDIDDDQRDTEIAMSNTLTRVNHQCRSRSH